MNIRRLTLFLMLAVLCIAGAGQASAFYNPGTGRWLSRDPLSEHAFYQAYTQNVPTSRLYLFRREALSPEYVFVRNNPLAFVDPLGLKILKSINVTFNQSSANPGAQPVGGGVTDRGSGRLFQGLMYTYGTTVGSDYYNVKSGGNIDAGSSIRKNPNYQPTDDTPIPSGNFSVETIITAGHIGFSVSGTSPRSGIEIHLNGVTTGCIAMMDGWEQFKQDMCETHSAGFASVPLSVQYKMSDGSNPPFGNSGNRQPDPGNPHPRIGQPSDTEGPPTPIYGEP